MIVLFAVMIILLIPALWAYSYIWRGSTGVLSPLLK